MPTLQAAIDDAIGSVASVFDLTDVQDDLEEEQSRHVAQVEQFNSDKEDLLADTAMDVDGTDPHASSQLRQTVESASQGVTDGTAQEYMRISRGIDSYLVDKGHIKAGETYFREDPPDHWPTLLIAWIMDSCDSRSSDGTLKDPAVQRATFAHAQKMRAAISFRFARIKSTAGISWHLSEVTSRMVGNPATAVVVSQYFVSLKRRKVQAGEAATSARAITPDILYDLYHYNISENRMVRRIYGAGEPKKWDGPLCRRMTFFAYLLMFTCLLRVDEVLKIQAHDIVLDPIENSITLTLPFRKTHQFGDIKPYKIYMRPKHEAHLCAVRAYAYFMRDSKIQRGYLFRNILAGDSIDINKSEPMKAAHFLEIFRNHLICVNIDPTPYGTHSFRRGGCQYYAQYKRWPLRKICEWGGWSQEFTHATIIKYLISWNDNPLDAREDFLRPGLPVGVHCHSCGRTCPCA